jgi:tetrahydromethanopterin S-methyltransferase subunit H
MLNFSKEQEVLSIKDVRFGGQPGETPSVLFGTLFYGKRFKEKSPEVEEEGRGYIAGQREMSELTGVGQVIDLFIGSEDQVEWKIGFLLDHLEPGELLSIDVPEAGVRIKALEYLGQQGALDKTIYNSLNLGVTPEEVEALKQNTPAASVVLGYNPKDFSTDGRMAMLENGGGMLEKGLIQTARDAGIENLLLDTGATPFDHNASETIRAVPVFKNKFGLPVGCAIHNTVESWLWMKDFRKEHKEEYSICDMGSNGLVIAWGADFAVYGPLRNAKKVFPFVAMVDKFMAEGARDYFGMEIDEKHPGRKLN